MFWRRISTYKFYFRIIICTLSATSVEIFFSQNLLHKRLHIWLWCEYIVIFFVSTIILNRYEIFYKSLPRINDCRDKGIINLRLISNCSSYSDLNLFSDAISSEHKKLWSYSNYGSPNLKEFSEARPASNYIF
jgi:hypothetical protein